MIKRIRRHAQRLARAARRLVTRAKKALKRLWRQHQHLMATQPAYRAYLKAAAAHLLHRSRIPAVLAAALLALLEQFADRATRRRLALIHLPH